MHYMRTLRTQMNDVEDQAAKISVEEQMQITTIHSLEKDISSAKAETKKLMDETDQMVKARGHICSKILENQKRVASLESDACTLSQTLELIQQERSNLSAKILEKSTYYSKVFEDMTSKLQEQQDWLDNKRQNEVTEARNMETNLIKEICGKDHPVACNLMKQTINELKSGMHDLKTELNTLDVIKLEEEHEAVVSEKSGEMEYMQTLQTQVEKLKGISHVVKCACGEEYKVEVANV